MLSFSGTVAATTIYSNFGPGGVYDGPATVVAGATSAAYFSVVGQAFTPSGNYQLSQIDLALLFISGTNSTTVSLKADAGGLPGALLATWSVSSLPAIGTCCIVQTFTPSSTIFLSAGTQYWIVAAPGASDTFVGWVWNSTGDTGVCSV